MSPKPAVICTERPRRAALERPSITGTKSEDTIIATSQGVQIITPAANWPMVTVEDDDGPWLRLFRNARKWVG